MSVTTASTTASSIEQAVDDIREQCNGISPKMVLFFASSRYDPVLISRAMHDAFSEAQVLGCSTAGEIISGRVMKDSIVAMAFDERTIEGIACSLVSDVTSPDSLADAVRELEDEIGTPLDELDFQQYVGIILIDGLSGSEERVMDRLGDLTDVTFIGGSAGDDLKFQSTHVYLDGKAYTNAAVLALLKPVGEFDIIKTQSFKPLEITLVPTKVNEDRREVMEFNDMPAPLAYARALGVSVEEAPKRFMHNPVGLVTGDDFFVRSPRQIEGDSILFYCMVKEGMELALLESTDIVADTRRAVDEKVRQLGGASALINFHCILRALELEEKGQDGAYGSLFTDIPTIGFSTYGEEYIGHINQTSTMLIFK
ncbi:FIST N-terminal domain-containing protein [Methanoculleus sp.]|uniref:FIST signal transduction protein n=1 Tax=Methanoculleus sp. TaxID=90427 RepID=UPI0025E56ACA|nr:FIST N-terminal domain-containing protein [Methanoculleus sp.]